MDHTTSLACERVASSGGVPRSGTEPNEARAICRANGCRGLVPQRAVRTLLVVFHPPRGDPPPRVPQIFKPTYVQALVPELAVETFHVPVLLRLPRLNVHQLDLPLHAPGQKLPAGELRPVVATNRPRLAPFRDDPFQHPRHAPAREAGVHFQRRTFPRVFIFYLLPSTPESPGHWLPHRAQNPTPIPGSLL